MLRETSQFGTLPPGSPFPLAEGSGYSPAGIRVMGVLMSSVTSPAPTQWVLPFALSRFQTFRPGAPPLPRPAAAVPPSRVPWSVLPRNGGDGTPGPCNGGPGPPTPSLGPVATPGRADVGAPREARALRPRNQPRPGACQSPAEPGREGAVGGRTSGQAAGYPEPEPEQGRAALGAAQGGAGRGAAARYSPAPGLCIQGPGPSERGAHGGAGGWGAGLTSPQSPEAAERL